MAFKISPTPATYQCAGLAVDALLWVLSSDPRLEHAYSAWLASPNRSDVTDLERFVRDDLHLPYPWLPQLLLTAFAATAVSQITGHPRRVSVTPAERLPGRGAKDGGQYILRDVEWYYQAEIKQPIVPKRKLAAEYQRTWTGTTVDPRGTIQTGIRRAKKLLSIFESFED
jgi:hypothetical protein